MFNKIILVFVLVFSFKCVYSQKNTDNSFNKKQDLTDKILKTNYKDSIENKESVHSKKNPAISIFLSLLLPGAGHLYAGRMDVGKYFVVSEAACWLGVIGLDLYGSALQNDSRTYAAEHSGLNKNGKDDNYFSNVGGFDNIYLYNNDKLAKGQWDQLYDVNTNYWNWDNSTNRNNFDLQRKKSVRTYDTRIIFATGLIVNRIISAISAIILTNKVNNNTSSGIRINSEIIRNAEYKYDGLKLNFFKSF
jgi:hypothetical protein